MSFSAQAQADCQNLKSDLRDFQKAQQQILTSLNNNHETAAATLEEYAELIQQTEGSQAQSLASKMKDSAQAFRIRGTRGVEIATKLDQGTAELIKRIQNCLK